MPLNKAGPRRRTIDTPDKSPRTQPVPVPKNSRPRFSQKAKLLPGIVLINRKPSLRKFYVYCSRREPGTHFPTFPARVTEHSKRTIRHAAPLKSHVGPPWGKSLSPSSPFARHVFQRTNAPLATGRRRLSVVRARSFSKSSSLRRERERERRGSVEERLACPPEEVGFHARNEWSGYKSDIKIGYFDNPRWKKSVGLASSSYRPSRSRNDDKLYEGSFLGCKHPMSPLNRVSSFPPSPSSSPSSFFFFLSLVAVSDDGCFRSTVIIIVEANSEGESDELNRDDLGPRRGDTRH